MKETIPVWVERQIKDRNSESYVPQRHQKQHTLSIAEHLLKSVDMVEKMDSFEMTDKIFLKCTVMEYCSRKREVLTV